jgi:hypothetical protein
MILQAMKFKAEVSLAARDCYLMSSEQEASGDRARSRKGSPRAPKSDDLEGGNECNECISF